MNVLIADDDPASRLILEVTLKKLGHFARVGKTGAEAFALFESGHFPVIVSDMLMPEMDGLELCRRIRAAIRPQYTYIILLTSVGGKSGYMDGMRAGADDFITKPFDKDVLAARLGVAERILNLQSQVKQLSGLLPICALCKRVRDDRNYWHQVENYISDHTDAKFSHGYCPECFKKVMGEIHAMTAAGNS